MSRADILERHEKGLHPYDPARAIARAYLNGLSALKDLLYRRIIKSIKHVYISTTLLGDHLLRNGWHRIGDARFLNDEHGSIYVIDLPAPK